MSGTAEQMRFCIVKVPYAGVDTENGKTISVDRYREVFETTLETRADAWVSPRTSLEVATEKLIDRYGKEKSHLLNWPTVYIVWFKNTTTAGGSSAKSGNRWYVYVGESQHILDRTVQHITPTKSRTEDIADNQESLHTDDADGEVAADHALSRYLETEKNADQRITDAVSNGADVNQYVIWERHFNKSLTLDVENKLIDYMKSIDHVDCLNGRGNPQDEYYTSTYLDSIVSAAWRKLVSKDEDGIFPPEEQIWQSSLYKVSPFHKLGKEQHEALRDIEKTVFDCLDRWRTPEDTRLILVGGAAGTGKTILLSTLFYELANSLNQDSDENTSESATHEQRVCLLVNNEDQRKVYDDMATKQGLQKQSMQCVSRPTKFINDRSLSVGTSSWDYTKIPGEDCRADVVLIDEAHLLFTQKVQSGIESHLHEILRRAKVVVAVFDPEQIMQRKQWWNPNTLRQLGFGENGYAADVDSADSVLTFTGHYSNAKVNDGKEVIITDSYPVSRINLTCQYRIDASDEVIQWVDALSSRCAQLPRQVPEDTTARISMVDEDGDNTLTLSCPYEIKVCSSPEEVFSEINKKRDWVLSRQEDAEETKPAKGRKKKTKRAAVKPRDLCRVVATFDWPYDSGDALGTVDLYYDPDYEWHCDGQRYRGAWRRPNYVDGDPEIPEHVKVFRRRWNRAKDILEDEEREKRQTGESWASDESTKNEVGSYFTIQGFDLNYVGVIIGPSVGYDEDRNCIVYRPEMSCDPGVTSSRKDISTSEDLEYFKRECIRKQLGVLTKRGVHGLYLFAVDPVLQKKLQDSMSV
ncbi:DNA/RNA helicase domain-containing protein [uncultured Bifidobacterium sp.]|uniref:DNA/RNA helicase domain-containing protein n=1 Tax=uncultured Bifidobacterium sp. TaxID=165187 RepID=UPI0025975E43|nr:DNA/RNA helicase domain-containing protein [uncultured Bifidobacterium sp.]